MDIIDKKIREALKNKGWTMKKLVGELNLTESGYTYMIKHNSIKVETLLKIATVLNTNVGFFFEDETNISINIKDNTVNGAVSNSGTIHVGSIKDAEKEIAHLNELLQEKEKQIKDKEMIIKLLQKQLYNE